MPGWGQKAAADPGLYKAAPAVATAAPEPTYEPAVAAPTIPDEAAKAAWLSKLDTPAWGGGSAAAAPAAPMAVPMLALEPVMPMPAPEPVLPEEATKAAWLSKAAATKAAWLASPSSAHRSAAAPASLFVGNSASSSDATTPMAEGASGERMGYKVDFIRTAFGITAQGVVEVLDEANKLLAIVPRQDELAATQ
eukprot:3678030-Prymnesium_polylepis.1